jgi:hypothetical protein
MKRDGHGGERDPLEARRHFAAKFAVVALTLLLAACGPTLEVENIGRAEIRKVAASKVVVVGQLQIRSAAGRSIFPTRPVWSYERPPEGAWVHLVQLTDDNTTFRAFPNVNANGRFAWAIGPGAYVINEIYGTSKITGSRSLFDAFWRICPKSAFRVERSTGIVNLGKIEIDLPSSDQVEGQNKSNFCEEPDGYVGVTQTEGEITRLVLKPLTKIVIAPELPLLPDTAVSKIDPGDVAEAKEVLRRHGFTIFGLGAADGQ